MIESIEQKVTPLAQSYTYEAIEIINMGQSLHQAQQIKMLARVLYLMG